MGVYLFMTLAERWFDGRSRLMARSRAPILVGPWRSELGFETLYWLPWLAKWRERYQIAKERLVIVTRGGAGVWYDAGKTADLYHYTSEDVLRRQMFTDLKRQQSIKQLSMTEWDRRLLDLVAEDVGLLGHFRLHPSAMYRALSPWWGGRWGVGDIMDRLAFQPLLAPSVPSAIPLPQSFLAVRFYARATWAMTPDSRAWVTKLIQRLAAKTPVVILSSPVRPDDHTDFQVSGEHILDLAPYVTPTNHLAIHSAVLSKAKAFVGTYGGTMQLAVRLGKPAAGFYQQFNGTAFEHRVLTEWLAVRQQQPIFIGRPEDATFGHELMRVLE